MKILIADDEKNITDAIGYALRYSATNFFLTSSVTWYE
jgi:hypothetical protein